MELDDLKQTWKKADSDQVMPESNIIELIQNKNYGPFAALKKRFRKQILLIVFAVAFLINNLSRSHQIFTDVMFWCYIAACTGVCLFFYYNYRLVSKMQCMDCIVKSSLERQVASLEKRLKRQLVAVRIMMVFFIILSELLPYFDNEPMLNKWHLVPPAIRALVYATVMVLHYFVSRALWHRKYGRHLSYVKSLLKEMQS